MSDAPEEGNSIVPVIEASSPTFPHFSEFPAEIRLKIWSHACLFPQNVDIWTEFQKSEIEDTIFYTQLYERRLSSTAVPAILHVSKEAREEGLKHFAMDFQIDTTMVIHPSKRKLVISHPGFHFNPESTRLVPRGFYNMIAMIDFMRRVGDRIYSIAIDVSGEFYRDLMKDYLEKGDWQFNSVREVVLYNAKGYNIFKKDYKGGRVTLNFIDSDPLIADANTKATWEKIFASISEKSKEAATKLQKGKTVNETTEDQSRAKVPVNFVCPRVRWMELVIE